MEPLEALLKDEEEVLASELSDLPWSPEAIRLLPYLKLDAYVGYIFTMGSLLLEDEEGPSTGEEITTNSMQLDRRQEAAKDKARAVSKKYQVAITGKDFTVYIEQLAQRILKYADEHLAGLTMETSPTPDLAEARLQPYPTTSDITNASMKVLGERPDATILEIVQGVRAFYDFAANS
ncbi:MAG: hypothetical protein AABX63_01470 [Nanoarchaeota archaeon]